MSDGGKLAALRQEVEALREEEREFVHNNPEGSPGRKASINAVVSYSRVLKLIAKHLGEGP